MPRRSNWHAVKIHHNYTVDEVARALGVAKGTVRRWAKSGLPALTDQKPYLILGYELVAFLKAGRPTKQRCQLDECFCFTCRTPRKAALGMADLKPVNSRSGNLRALCAVCSTVMCKQVPLTKLSALRATLEVTIVQGGEPIGERVEPSANVHLPREPETHA